MKIRIQVKAGRQEESFRFVNGIWLLKINAPAREGLANQRIETFLANLFHLPKTGVTIVKGHQAPFKTIEIPWTEQEWEQWQQKHTG